MSTSWCFTSYQDEDYVKMSKHELVQYLIYGNEICPKTQRPHRQGYIQLKKSRKMGWVGKLFSGNPHFERSNGTDEQNKKYCSKDRDFYEFGERKTRCRSGKKRKFEQISDDLDEDDEATFLKYGKSGIEEKKCLRRIRNAKRVSDKIKDKMEKLTLNENQEKWLKDLLEQNDRQVTWVWDQKGNSGKSTFGKYLKHVKGAIKVCSGKLADLCCMIANEQDDGNESELIVMDLVRTQEDFFNYAALENFKDGTIPNTKYKSRMMEMFEPKIIVLANFGPDIKKMTEDRWSIIIPE